MKIEYEYKITIGLLKADMTTTLKRNDVLKSARERLSSLGVDGFKVLDCVGEWKGESEPSLEISFINTFGVQEQELIVALSSLGVELDQEAVLLEKTAVSYGFI